MPLVERLGACRRLCMTLLRFGERTSRGGRFGFRLAPSVAHRALCDLSRLARLACILPHGTHLARMRVGWGDGAFEIGKPVALTQAHGGGRRRFRRRGEAVPAPHIAFAADEA